jgi:predicted Ser/Thr protein kinase
MNTKLLAKEKNMATIKKQKQKKHKKNVCRLPPKDAQNNKVEVVVRFIDIGRIGDHGDHHCLHFRFIINQ